MICTIFYHLTELKLSVDWHSSAATVPSGRGVRSRYLHRVANVVDEAAMVVNEERKKSDTDAEMFSEENETDDPDR